MRAYGQEQFSLKIHMSPSKDIVPNAHYFIEDENRAQQVINCYDCIKIFESEEKFKKNPDAKKLSLPMQEVVIDF